MSKSLTSAKKELKLTGSLVDLRDELRMSALFTEMQELAEEHADASGVGRSDGLKLNRVWVINRYHLRIFRMPRFQEAISIVTWVGEPGYVAYPRYFEVFSEEGDSLIRVASVWCIIDKDERRLLPIKKTGMLFEHSVTGTELPYKVPLVQLETDKSADFKVPYSYVDQNRHMNNCRYMDVADDLLYEDFKGRRRIELRVEYNNEIRLGETLRTEWGSEGGTVFLRGSCPDGRPCFKMNVFHE